MAIPKTTHRLPQSLTISGKAVTIPPGTFIVPSLLAVHTHPKYWQPEPLTWLPSRWIERSTAISSRASSKAEELEREELVVPRKGTYFPWSEGPQFCPGKKFAQVEFVAVLAYLFRYHRVRPVLEEGESAESGRKRALAVCEDSEHVLLLRMRDGDSIRLMWEKV